MKNISINKGSGKISIQNFADSISYNGPNLIQNPNFDQDNYYPYDGYDQNYYGDTTNGSVIMSKYWHNSPLRYELDPFFYATLFRKTFHIAKPPYDQLPYDSPLQKRFMKILPVGNRFPEINTDLGLIRTISNIYSPANGGGNTDLTSWVKYSAETIGSQTWGRGTTIKVPILIPAEATTVNFGCSIRIAKNDQLRPKNFGGIFINFKKSTYRSYVNYIAVCGNEVPTLLGDGNPYTTFNADSDSNAMSQWLGPNTSKVKVKKLSQTFQDDTYDSWRIINGSVAIPTFSTADNDATDGRAEYVSLHMYLAESFVYLNNNDDVDTGGMFFYNPYLYFS